jgi:hypothetical protein
MRRHAPLFLVLTVLAWWGTFNVVDDEPAPVAEWLPELARAIDVRPPLHVPALVAPR